MKKFILISFLVLGSFKISAQIQYLSIANDSTSYCDNIFPLNLSLEVGTSSEVDPIITIYWGDGTTDVVNNGVYYQGYSNFIISHSYANSGAYAVYATFLSSVNSQEYVSNSFIHNYYGQNMCGSIYPYVYQNMNCGLQGNWYYDATYDVTDANGVTSTFTGNMVGVDITAVPYTLSLNDIWLQENNLSQVSSDVTITAFDNYGYPNVNLSFQVGTLNQTNVPDYVFGYAYAYGHSPLEELKMGLMIYNQNCGPIGTLRMSLTFPSELIPNITDLLNPLVSGNVLSFDLTEPTKTLFFYMPGTTPEGTEFPFSISIADLSGDETNISNNILNFNGIVFNSFDPNNKLVNRAQNINPNEQEELIYTINFQNEGNFDAINVKVVDTLSANLDLSTFHVLDSKHNVVTTLNEQTNVVEFKFTSINLAPKVQDEEGSKGFVTYVIKEKANLPIDSEIENTAYIYFDFNPAIITNTTYNKNALLSVSQLEDNEFNIYPNPVKNKLTVESKMATNELILIDLNGKIILKQKIGFKGQIDLSAIENGVYYLQMLNENASSIQKVVVNK